MTARWRLLAAIFLGVLALAFAAAWIWWILRPPTPGPLRLTKTSFSALPGWSTSDPSAALSSFLRSCAVLTKETAATPMGGAGYAGTAADWRAPCQAAQNQKTGAARAFFQQWFVPVEISAGRVENGLFTGYYEPQLRASRSRHGRFQTPVYGVPDDLISVDLGAFRPSLHGEHIAGRVDGNRLVPYATRADIDAHGLPSAPILFYADDPVAVFFLHIQGSGRVRFEDGTEKRVSYAAQNGQLYTPIGRVLIDRGALTRQDLSMQSIRAWLLAHPAAARSIMEADASYIFFKEETIGDAKLGAKGAEGVPLTPGASVAVDTRLHVLGAPYYIATALPDSKPLRSLFVAQDIGGAIRGPVRADIFFGFGKTAEQLAGGMKQRGRLYVLLPKSVAARLAPRTDYPATMP
ncbi:MAG: murein transglycosylase A [Alphaproteobacteria bacterium]|nr:murein transglycosylase A [Alphaproteobacteria bacterium]